MAMESQVSRSPLTPLYFLRRCSEVYPDKTAIIYGERRFTYAEFGQRVNRLANALRAIGVQHQDRVAILCPNTPAMLEAHFGVPLAGGVLVPINIRLSAREVAYILQHSDAQTLLVDTEFADLLRDVIPDLTDLKQVINIVDPTMPEFEPLMGPDYEEFLCKADDFPVPWHLEDEQETIAVNYTSGTTGRPKGVMYSHRGAYLNAVGETIETKLGAESVFLWTLPMFHCNGWCFTWGVTAVGATHVCIRKPEPSEAWSLIASAGVTHLNGAPTVALNLINDAACPERLPRPLTVCVAGAPPSPTLIARWESLDARIIHVYGLTETYGPHTVCAYQQDWQNLEPDERARRLARQGVCYVVTESVRVVDENMQDVPCDGTTMGEVVMRGNNVMKGYYRDADATAEAFRGGWFHSGDLAVMHPDRYIELKDRSKDIIISGGENISSIEVEQTICRHSGVREVAVVGVPHEKWGETPKAFVSLQSGCEATADEIIEFCRQQMAHYKCPTAVEFTELPKTSTGKVRKYELRENEWAGRDRRIGG